jgi:hypothetical protein
LSLATSDGNALAPPRAEAAPRLSSQTIFIALAVAAAIYCWRLIGAFTRFPGTTIDARFNQAILEHLWLWASGRASSLADPGFFYPYRGVLYLSDTHFGSGWVYVICRALGAPREVAFDLWFLAGMASTFAAALYGLRRFGLPAAAAAFGALVFAFSLPMLAQDAHAQLVYRFAVPLATLACVEFVRRPGLGRLAALGLWVGWQFLCSVYIGVFLCEWLAFVGVFALMTPLAPSPSKGEAGLAETTIVCVAAALALGLAAYMMWRHAEIARAYAIHHDLAEIGEMAPRWTSLLSMAGAPSVGWLSARLPHHTPMWDWEHQLFPGLGVLLLAAAGVRRSPAAALCLVATLGLLAFNLDVDGGGLWRFTSQAPGLNAIRSPGRVALVAAFPLAWLAGLGVAALRRSHSQAAFALLIAGLGLALVDIASFRSASVSIASARARVAAMSQGLDGEALRARHAVLLRFGAGSNEQETMRDLDLMLAAQELGVATINGYSGSVPPLYARPRDCAEAKAWLGKVDALPYKRAGADDIAARAVIVPPGACGQ